MTVVGTRMVEVRWHGRGGQGGITASNILAEACLQAGSYFQSFPEFGPERSGAPILAYTRISDEPIFNPNGITDPDIVIVLDPSLIGRVDFLAGLKRSGLLLVNTTADPTRLRKALGVTAARTATVDASRISQECLKRNFPNVPILGALVRVEALVSKEALAATIQRQLGEKLSAKVLQQNMEALQRGYGEVRQE